MNRSNACVSASFPQNAVSLPGPIIRPNPVPGALPLSHFPLCFFASKFAAPDFLDCFGNCEAILQLLELCRRGLVQIIDLACVGGNGTVKPQNCGKDPAPGCQPPI